jgi:U3 small nucleolar RNA-associated protein 4
MLASGGLDMSVVVTPAALPASTSTRVVNPLSTSTVATFEDSYHRRLAYNSGTFHASAIHVARQARLVLCQRDSGLSVWRILDKGEKRGGEGEGEADEMGPLSSAGGWEHVLDMDLSVHTNLVASAISDDGRWIVVADWYESKLFRLQKLVRLFKCPTFSHNSDLIKGQRRT